MKKKSFTGFLLLFFSLTMMAQVLPFPEDTIAYNDLFNNRQWVQYDSQGHLHITYTGQSGTAAHTREIYYVTDKTGELETTQITQTTVDSNFSVFTIDDDDNIHLVYIERDGSNNFQLLYRNTVDGDFSDPISITSGTNKGPAYIAWSSDNVVHFVFHSFISGQPDHAYYKSYDLDTETLSAEVQLALSDVGSEHDVRVVTDSSNHAHIILRTGSVWGGQLKYYNNKTGDLQEYVLPVTETIEYPALLIDEQDVVHVIYRLASTKQIWYFTRTAEGVSSEPVAVTPPGIGNPSFYRTIGLDDEGRLYIGYQNSISSAPTGFFLVHGKDGVFAEPILVWNDPQDLYLLRNTTSVTARGNGEVAVLYAPSAVRNDVVVCDIFLKQGNIFAEPEALIEVNPLSLDFGTVEVNSWNEQVVTISNPGFEMLNFSLAFSNNHFFSPTDGPVSVDPQSSVEIPVVFQVEQPGEYTGELTIASNAANNPEVVVELEGVAVMPQLFSLTFIVTDPDHQLVTDAVITLNGEGFPAGNYLFENLEAGQYEYSIEKAGFEAAQGTAVITDEDVTEEVVLQPLTWSVTFIVLDEENQPVTHAIITLNGNENLQGDYLFTGILPGTYAYTISAEGFFTVSDELTVTDEDLEQTVILPVDDTSVHLHESDELKVFPNPASGFVTLTSETVLKEVVIKDMSGRIVQKIPVGDRNVTFSVDALREGYYILQVKTSEGMQQQKIQVSR
ncbi:MAG: choice-of-anchor D domain-containing protein [Bacteroidetes bacterium]|nr:MAG: choice-of-anchor D domain-containing protein [Bacteroidota bacterium]